MTDPQPVAVVQWYDRHTRSWITTWTDADGAQVGDASYVGRRVDAVAEKARYEAAVRESKAAQ